MKQVSPTLNDSLPRSALGLLGQVPVEANIHDLTDSTRRLQATTTQIESFLTGQLQRLFNAMQVYTQIKVEAETVRRKFGELEIDRQRWEAQRDAEVIRLQSASDKLIAAWEQLDTTQRQLLIDRRDNDPSRPSITINGGLNQRSSPRPGNSPTSIPACVQSTLLEIQMLKREMLHHTQRRN